MDNECSICLEVISLPMGLDNCSHIFCQKCIVKWLLNNKNCPICRKDSRSLASFHPRLESLSRWVCPPSLKLEDVAENGFYCVGRDDYISCYYCGVFIRITCDIRCMWELHSKLSRTCPRIKLYQNYEKRQDFKRVSNNRGFSARLSTEPSVAV